MKFSFLVEATPSQSFDFIASTGGMESFRGGFGVPGIKRARIDNQYIIVQDSWGFTNREKLVQVKRGSLLVFYIKPNPVISKLIRSISEEWHFFERQTGTEIVRSFSFDSNWNPPLFLFKRAIEKHNQDLARLIKNGSPKKQSLLDKP